MASKRIFRKINERHVVSEDDVHVDLINGSQLTYGKPEHYVTVEAERYIARDGAPDGRVIALNPGLRWSDGMLVTPTDLEAMRHDLLAAAVPLQSKIRFDAL